MSRLHDLLIRLDGWPRRALALALLLLALATGVQSARSPSPGAGATVVVAARDLPAGAVVSAQDVRLSAWAAAAPPGAFRRTADVIGQRVAGPVGAAELLTSTRLVGAGLTTGLGDDQVALTVPIAGTGAATVERAGDRVDLIAAPVVDGAAATLVAQAVRVLAVLPAPDGARADSAGQLVVAVDRPVAVAIATAAGRQLFAAVVRGT